MRAEKRKSSFRQRLLQRYGLNIQPELMRQPWVLPGWMIGWPIGCFLIAFAACTIVFGRAMEPRYAIIASASVILFLYGGYLLSRSMVRSAEPVFLRQVFSFGLFIHLLWVAYCYFCFNPDYYETTWGDSADVVWYMPYGKAMADWLTGDTKATFGMLMKEWRGGLDDTGYPMWLAIEYLLTFRQSDVLVPMIVKAVLSTYCAISIYHVAKRHFGIGTARYAAVFVTLNPNMIYWCGTMMKEPEMVFLCCLFVDKMDQAISAGKMTFRTLWPALLAGLALFFFRSALGMVAFLAVITHLVFVSRRVLSAGKKVIAGVLIALTLVIGMGERLRTQVDVVTESIQSNDQQTNMDFRTKRKGGNSFAKYAGTAVFAPLIFTIPFPSFNIASEGQIVQRMLSGGSYIKNILSFFVIFVMFIMLLSGEWRRHVFIIAYTCGYMVTLAMSSFAQSGRFHMPVMPMLMLFAAYGIQIANGNVRLRRGFSLILILEVVISLGWNWFKLKGRGMI